MKKLLPIVILLLPILLSGCIKETNKEVATTTTEPTTITNTYSQRMACGVVDFTLESSRRIPFPSQTKPKLYYKGLCSDDFTLWPNMYNNKLEAQFIITDNPSSDAASTLDFAQFEYTGSTGTIEGLLNIPNKENGAVPMPGSYYLCVEINYIDKTKCVGGGCGFSNIIKNICNPIIIEG